MQKDLQGTEEWFAERLGLITASNFYKIMARHKKTGEPLVGYYEYLNQVVQEILTGIRVEIPDNEYMAWGRDYESLAKTEYMLRTGKKVLSVGFSRLDQLPIGCSPDGDIDGENAGIEIKCPTTKTHLETVRTGLVSERYLPQVHGQIFVRGYDYVDFVSYDPRIKTDARLFIIRVEKDEAYRTELATKLYEFAKLVRSEVEKLGGTYDRFSV